jgi:HTH-type transcriptional regulator / antitoxin HipB
VYILLHDSYLFTERDTMIPISDTKDLGKAIRHARKELGLTQPQLALATGVGVRFIVDLEAGKPTVQLVLVLRVIEALGGQVELKGLPIPSTDSTDKVSSEQTTSQAASTSARNAASGSTE